MSLTIIPFSVRSKHEVCVDMLYFRNRFVGNQQLGCTRKVTSTSHYAVETTPQCHCFLIWMFRSVFQINPRIIKWIPVQSSTLIKC